MGPAFHPLRWQSGPMLKLERGFLSILARRQLPGHHFPTKLVEVGNQNNTIQIIFEYEHNDSNKQATNHKLPFLPLLDQAIGTASQKYGRGPSLLQTARHAGTLACGKDCCDPTIVCLES